MTKKSKQSARSPTPAAERVVWLLNGLFDGNRSKMAESVGCTHSVLTKIVNLQQGVGRRLLDKIASHPKVNPVWLMTGEGEPLLKERQDDHNSGRPLPIAEKLFRGLPTENPNALSGDVFAVAGAFYEPDRYWLKLNPGFPIVRSKYPLIDGDLLLMHTDSSWWSDDGRLDGRLCVVALGESPEASLELGLVTFIPADYEEAAHLKFNNFSGVTDQNDLVRVDPVTLKEVGPLATQPSRMMWKSRRADGKLSPVNQIHFASFHRTITAAQVVAVCIHMTRRFS